MEEQLRRLLDYPHIATDAEFAERMRSIGEFAVHLSLAAREALVTLQARETILVVDDEVMVRRLAARILVNQGYRALEASGEQEAVRMLRRGSPEIDGVLTDLAMPGLGGRQLGETIARCWPEVRVLYMSGFPAQRMVKDGALDPKHPFIQKPFTSEQLIRKVRELLVDHMRQ